jgi:hypothetical protein
VTAEDLRRIERGLKRGPQALGYESDLWTSARVAHLIEKECGVRYPPRGHQEEFRRRQADGPANGLNSLRRHRIPQTRFRHSLSTWANDTTKDITVSQTMLRHAKHHRVGNSVNKTNLG